MREMKDSGIEWIGEIPKSWTITILSALFSERKCKNSGLTENNLLSLSYGNIVRKNSESNEGLLPASFETYNIIEPGNIVFRLTDLQNDKRSLRTGLCQERGIITSAYVTLQIRSDDSPRYMHYLFHTYDLCKVFYGMGDGVRQGMNYEDLKRLRILRPDRETQRRIADYLDRKCSQIDDIIARQQEVIEKLKAYKLSVITEAVTKGLNPDVLMKDSGVEWIGEIPEHWEIRRIGSFARVTSSKRIFEESYVDEGVPFYRSKEITDLSKGLHVQTEIFIPEEVFEQVNEASPAPKCGDILLTSIGTIGNTWISDGRKFYYKDGNITQIEANDSFDSAYVEYCFSSNVVLEQYTRLAMGSTLLALTIIKIKKILVAFPPLDEQRKIVQYLKLKYSSIDAAIKNKENLITKLADYKKSLIYEVVTGKKEV